MIKSLNISVEAVVMYKNRFDKETLDLYRRVYTTCIEKEDVYIFVNRKHHIDPGIIRIVEKDIMYLSELFCEYSVEITFPIFDTTNLKRYQYLNTTSKFLTKENVHLKAVQFRKVRWLSLFESNIEVSNDTIMEDIKSAVYSHYKDNDLIKQPLGIVCEDIPNVIFKNISEIVDYNLNNLSEVFK